MSRGPSERGLRRASTPPYTVGDDETDPHVSFEGTRESLRSENQVSRYMEGRTFVRETLDRRGPKRRLENVERGVWVGLETDLILGSFPGPVDRHRINLSRLSPLEYSSPLQGLPPSHLRDSPLDPSPSVRTLKPPRTKLPLSSYRQTPTLLPHYQLRYTVELTRYPTGL